MNILRYFILLPIVWEILIGCHEHDLCTLKSLKVQEGRSLHIPADDYKVM